MKTVNSDLLNLLTSSSVGWMADAYRIVLPSGEELRYTDADVSIRMPYRDTVLSFKPILYYPFLSSSSPMKDEVPLGHDGITSGSPTHNTDPAFPYTYMTLDGASRLLGPQNDTTTTYDERDFLNLQHSFSIILWIRPDTTKSGNLEGLLDYGGRLKVFLQDATTQELHFEFSFLGIDFPRIPFSRSVSSGWNLIGFSWDGISTWTVFHNGSVKDINLQQRSSIEYLRRFRTWDDDDNFDYTLSIGSASGSSFNYVGDVAHFAIFPRAMAKEDFDLLYSSATSPIVFTPGPILSRSTIKEQVGVQVDELGITLSPRLKFDNNGNIDQNESDMIGDSGTPLLYALNNHGLEGSKIYLYRCFSPSPPRWPQNTGSAMEPASTEVLDVSDPANPVIEPTGCVLRFVGFISSIQAKETESEITVKSALAYLDQQLPKYIVRAGCAWNLFSKGCGLNREDFRVDTTISSTQMSSVWKLALTPTEPLNNKADNYFALGYVEFKTGKNSFLRRSIKTSSGTFLELGQPLPYPPEPGDQVSLFPGCDKTISTCTNKFDNLKHFRGFPLTPPPDSLIGIEPDDFEPEEV